MGTPGVGVGGPGVVVGKAGDGEVDGEGLEVGSNEAVGVGDRVRVSVCVAEEVVECVVAGVCVTAPGVTVGISLLGLADREGEREAEEEDFLPPPPPPPEESVGG